jgi:hypothetical protein
MVITMAKGRSCDVVGETIPAWLEAIAATGCVHLSIAEAIRTRSWQRPLAVNEHPAVCCVDILHHLDWSIRVAAWRQSLATERRPLVNKLRQLQHVYHTACSKCRSMVT